MSWARLCLVLLAAIATALGDNDTTYDTIVVGLGSAGATAAAALARAGARVLALEAQPRAGGRVRSRPFGDGIVEVGAEWIHGTHPSRVYDAAVENNVTVLPQEFDFIVMRSDGTSAGEAIADVLNKAHDFMEDDSGVDRPMSEVLTTKLTEYTRDKYPTLLNDTALFARVLHLLNLNVGSLEASSDWSDVNIHTSYRELQGYQHTSWHRHGYKTFFDILLNKHNNGTGLPTLDIKLNTEVTKIHWPQNPVEKVTVTTKDGANYTANNVIVTVSLGVLKERHQDLFSPPLPEEKVTAIEKIVFGVVGKIILSFSTPWWKSRTTWYDLLWTDEDLKAVPEEDRWTTDIGELSFPMGSNNTVTLWTVGDVAKKVESLPLEVVKDKAMGLLRRFFGKGIDVPEPTAVIKSDWYSNPFTRGSYSYDSVRAAQYPRARADLAAPVRDSAGTPRVLFAGEATSTQRFSTVHGASDTGYREAMRLLKNEA